MSNILYDLDRTVILNLDFYKNQKVVDLDINFIEEQGQ